MSKLISLIHDITQLGVKLKFSDDFDGMVTLHYLCEGLDWRHHEHLGWPGCTRAQLEEKVVTSLESFLEDLQKRMAL